LYAISKVDAPYNIGDEQQPVTHQMITYSVLRAIGESLDPDTVIHLAVETAARLTSWPTVSVHIPDRHGKPDVRASVGPTPVYQGISSRAFRTGHTQIVPKSQYDVNKVNEPQVNYCAVSVPMRRGGRRLGVFNAESRDTNLFGPEDILLAESLAEVIALALDNAQLFAQAQRRLRAQTALQKAGSVIASTIDLSSVLERVAEQMGRAIDATSAYISSYEPETLTSTVLAEYYGPRATKEERVSDLGVTYHLPKDFPKDVEFLEKGDPIVDHLDEPQDLTEAELAHMLAYGAKSTLSMPLQVRGKTVAFVELWESWHRRDFSAEEVELVQSIGQQATSAIENARLFTETQRRLLEQTRVREAGTFISSTLDLPTVLYRIAEQISRAVDSTSAYICSYEADDATSTVLAEYISPHASPKERAPDIGTTYYLPDDFPGTVELLESEDAIVAHIEDPDLADVEKQHMKLFGAISSLTVPIKLGGRVIAYAELWESRSHREFTREEITLCQGVAQQAAIAIENARLFETVKEQHGRLKALIESSNEGIVLIGTDASIMVTNPVALRLLRLEGDPEYWSGRSIIDALRALRGHAPEAVKTAITELRRLKSGTASLGEGEVAVPPGTIHWRSAAVKKETNLIGRFVILRDTTKEQLLKRTREDMTHTLVHDFRGPLTAISTSLDLLDTYGTKIKHEEKRAEAMVRAREGAQRIQSLVNDILDVSRLESGKMQLDYEAVSIVHIARKILDLQRPITDDMDLKLENDIPIMTPLVWGDKRLIERALQNLVDNAIKYTPSGGLIQVAAQIDPLEQSHLIVTVTDDGTGIPDSVKNRLFEKFAKGDRSKKGSGLGLYFCRMVVEAHNGRIWLGNKSKAGTSINMALPVFKAD
jgi:signal transduction histidine kinase